MEEGPAKSGSRLSEPSRKTSSQRCDPMAQSISKSKRRFSVVGVLVALVVSSSLAYLWPTVSSSADPFRLSANALLGLVALTMFYG